MDTLILTMIVGGQFAGAFYCLYRYSDRQDKRWLFVIAAIFLTSYVVSNRLFPDDGSPSRWDEGCIEFRGSIEC